MDRRPDAGKPELPGAASTRIQPRQDEIGGEAADPDKSFILCHAFRNMTGACETSFYLQATVLPFFPIPKDYLPGLDLVVAAAARR